MRTPGGHGHPPPAPPGRAPRLYLVWFSVGVATIVLLGFTRTFFLPLVRHAFAAPWFVYIHGALFFAWIALLVAQAHLVAARQVPRHRSLGRVAAVLIPLMVASGVIVALWSTARDYRAGGGPPRIAFFYGQLTDLAMFTGFAVAALLARRRPPLHKRLILLATLAVFGAAAARVPIIGAASNYVTLVFLLALAGYDWRSSGRLHPLTLAGGLVLMAGTFTQDAIGASPLWQELGPALIRGIHYGGLPPG